MALRKKAATAAAAPEKTAAVQEAEKPAAKTRKAPAAKKAAAPQVELHLQYLGKDLTQEDMMAAVKAQCGQVEIQTLQLYIKPEDQAIYYVVNGEVSGKVEL